MASPSEAAGLASVPGGVPEPKVAVQILAEDLELTDAAGAWAQSAFLPE